MKFVFHWRGNAPPSTFDGDTAEQAFAGAGYGNGAVSAVDYYHEEGRPITVLGHVTCGCDRAQPTEVPS